METKPGVLLINLGTPEAPTPKAVRAYLREFLSDPRVVELPRALWLPILHLFVLRTRPKASAARYERIWTREGSPLRVHTQAQAALVKGYLGDRLRVPLAVDYAMRYGKPSIGEKLESLKAQGCEGIVVIPLYPQYSGSTTGTVLDALKGQVARGPAPAETRVIDRFHDDPGYIGALETTLREHWEKRGRADVTVMSFHGIPKRAVERGDPYYAQCQETARLLAQAVGLEPAQYRVTFQSRFGRAEWLKPYTFDVLAELGRRKTERVDVICPGFVTDCLETLEEIAIEAKALFLEAGGREFQYIPCLNERHEWIEALCGMIVSQLEGWLSIPAPQKPRNPLLHVFSSGT